MRKKRIDQLREIVREKKLVRARELVAYGIPRHCLASLMASGEIERIARGASAVVSIRSFGHPENQKLYFRNTTSAGAQISMSK